MQRKLIPLTLAGLLLAGCTGNPPSSARWSLAALPDAEAIDVVHNPAKVVELYVALTVARERCHGNNERILRHLDPGLLFYKPQELSDVGQTMGAHYRRVYGGRWWSVLSQELREARLRYENHSDPEKFCRAAAGSVHFITRIPGPERREHLHRVYQLIAAPQPAARTSAN